MPVILRPAEMTDSDFLFQVANAPSVRQWCIKKEPITSEQHFDYMFCRTRPPKEERRLFVFEYQVGAEREPICYGRIDSIPVIAYGYGDPEPSQKECLLSY